MQFAISATSSLRNYSVSHRHHGLDALRGIATVLVVLLHAGIPYMTKPMPFLVWPARDTHPCPVVDGLTWCAECFLMPLFFLLAGFFSHGLLVARGDWKFLTGRTKRLLSTQLAADAIILPVCLWIWSMGWVADGLYEPKDYFLRGIPPELEAEMFGVAHLWFLQNLYIYCLILCGVSWFAKRIRWPQTAAINWLKLRPLDTLLVSAWKPMIPAIPCALILYCDTRIVVGFYQSFFPVISKLLYYAIYFFVGTALYCHRDKLHLHARFGKTYLFIAGMLFSATLPLIHEHTTVPLNGPRLALLAGLLASFAWFTVFGLFAICLQTKYGDNVVTRYLAEASFWVYLIHLPLVVLTQMATAQLPVPALGKFLLVGMTAVALALMTYQVFVRGCWLGEFLGGHCRSFAPAVLDSEPVVSPCPPIVAADPIAGRVTRRIKRANLWIDRPLNHRNAMKRRNVDSTSGVELRKN